MGILEKYIQKRLSESMGLKEGESVLILTDDKKREIGERFYWGAKKVCSEVGLMAIKPREYNREEPPLFVAEAMKRADVVIMATFTSFTHTTARINASKAGARIASMPGINAEMIGRDFKVGYGEVAKYAKKVAGKLTGADRLRVTTKFGTDITFKVGGRGFLGVKEGLYLKRGAYGNIPAGEVFVVPLEGTSNGRIVVDASMASVGRLREPIEITVKGGFATSIRGGQQAKTLQKFIWGMDKNSRNIAEFGIGTNPLMRITGTTLEDEKVRGTAHFALGDNFGMGGKTKAKIHLDGVMLKPNIYADKKLVIKEGELF